MFRKSLYLVGTVVLLSLFSEMVKAQDFQKTYILAENSKVGIKNVAGNVRVKGYDGTEIRVTAIKEGRDKDLLSIEDFSNDSRVDIRVKYPQNCNCEAAIHFEMQVPRTFSYDYDAISTVGGNLTVEDVKGMVRADNVSGVILLRNVTGTLYASSFSGDVTVEQAAETATRGNGRWRRGYQRFRPGDLPMGSILAQSVSGNVKVMLARLDEAGTRQMEFSSVSGNVEIRVPESLGAIVEMATMVGKLETDFPLVVVKDVLGLGSSARGQVGDGARKLKITSTAGNISLRKN